MATKATSTASAGQYREDVSDVIQEKISLFRSQEHRISALELELNDLREQHNRLEQELEPYRHQYRPMSQFFFGTHNDLCPIHHLPDELLCSIFKFSFQIPDYNHQRDIGRLLFVCKRWYTLTMGSPTLWSNIRVDDPYELFNLVNRRPQISYFNSCLARSQEVPLDVEVHLQEFDEMSYIKQELYQGAKAVIDLDEHDAFSDQIHAQDWHFNSPRFHEEVGPFFDRFFGDEGQHLKRCRSLTIELPWDGGVADIICLRMAKNVSNLTSLKILGTTLDWPIEHVLSHIDLPKVKHLTVRRSWGGPPLSLSQLSLSPTALDQINMDVGRIFDLEILSSFKYLRFLELTFWAVPTQVVAAPLFSIQLPFLEYLCLIGFYVSLLDFRFESPSLQVLSLAPISEYQRLPALSSSPRKVEWRFDDAFLEGIKQDPKRLVPLFEDAILLSKTIQRMTIPWSLKDPVLELVGQYQKKGQIPSLSHIMLERVGHASQLIEVGRLS